MTMRLRALFVLGCLLVVWGLPTPVLATDSTVLMPTGQKLDTEQVTVGVNDVQRQRIEVSGTTATAIAAVLNTAPTTEFGLVVRNIPSGTQAVSNAGTFATQAAQSGTWTVQPGNTANSTAWLVTGAGGTFPVTGPLTDTQLRATAVPVSGTVTTSPPANASTNLTQLGGTAISLNTGVRDAGTQRVTVATNDSVPVTGTFWQATQPVSGTVTATGPLTDTQLRATAVPVSGTVATTQSGTWTVQPGNTANTTAWLVTGTGGIFPATQSGSWTVAANAGTNLNTSALALEASLVKLPLTQSSTTSGQSGPLMQGAVTESVPVYVSGQTNPLSLTVDGELRTLATVSGTVSSAQSGTWNIGTVTTLSNIPCGYAEDVVHASGEVGCLVLGVRTDNPAVALAGTTGDRIPFITDSKGQIWVTSDNVFTVQPRAMTIKEFTFLASDAAPSNTALVSTTSGTLTVTYALVTCSPATSITVPWRLGFAAATLPAAATTGAAGVFSSGWFSTAGSAGLSQPFTGTAIGAAGEDLRLTMSQPTGGQCNVVLHYVED
jgi:hypothetical protein